MPISYPKSGQESNQNFEYCFKYPKNGIRYNHFRHLYSHGIKSYNGNTGDKDILALDWYKIILTIRKSTETFHYWRLLENPFIKFFRRLYSKGLALGKVNLAEFSQGGKVCQAGF